MFIRTGLIRVLFKKTIPAYPLLCRKYKNQVFKQHASFAIRWLNPLKQQQQQKDNYSFIKNKPVRTSRFNCDRTVVTFPLL